MVGISGLRSEFRTHLDLRTGIGHLQPQNQTGCVAAVLYFLQFIAVVERDQGGDIF